MNAAVQIESASELDPALCRHLILSTEPWITLQYDESDVQAIVRSAQRDNLLVARSGDAVVGFALSAPGILLGEYLKILVVEDAHRLHGVGRELMEGLEQRAFRSWPNVYLCVSDFNHAARRFYDRLGYEAVGSLKGLLIPGRDEVLMRKSIAAWRGFGGKSVPHGAA
jgi:[ribosomal protein S18]-alanine N-acetyltransferase